MYIYILSIFFGFVCSPINLQHNNTPSWMTLCCSSILSYCLWQAAMNLYENISDNPFSLSFWILEVEISSNSHRRRRHLYGLCDNLLGKLIRYCTLHTVRCVPYRGGLECCRHSSFEDHFDCPSVYFRSFSLLWHGAVVIVAATIAILSAPSSLLSQSERAKGFC